MQDHQRTPATRPDAATRPAPTTPKDDQSAPPEETLHVEALEERIAPSGGGARGRRP